MIIRLSDFKARKSKKEVQMVRVPVFESVFVEDNKLIGRQCGTGKLIVIKDYGEDES